MFRQRRTRALVLALAILSLPVSACLNQKTPEPSPPIKQAQPSEPPVVARLIGDESSSLRRVFVAVQPVKQILMFFNSSTEVPSVIQLELKRVDSWISCPISTFVPTSRSVGLIIDIASPLPEGTVFRVTFTPGNEEQPVGLRTLRFNEGGHSAYPYNPGVPEHESLANGYISLQDWLDTALYPPAWYRNLKIAQQMDKDLSNLLSSPVVTTSLAKTYARYKSEILKLPEASGFWKKKSDRIEGDKRFVELTLTSHRIDTSLVLLENTPVNRVVLYLPGSGETAINAYNYLPGTLISEPGNIVALATLSHARPGNDIFTEGYSPILASGRVPLGEMTSEVVAAIQFLRASYPGLPIIVAGWSIGGQLALLASSEADGAIVLMPGLSHRELYLSREDMIDFPYVEVPGSNKDVYVSALVQSVHKGNRVYMLDNLAGDFRRLATQGPLAGRFVYQATDESHGPFKPGWLIGALNAWEGGR